MELITQAACRATPRIGRVLDIGCGAGNNTLLLARYAPGFDCDLVDLSRPMLERAHERLAATEVGTIGLHQGEFRSVELPGSHDVVLAAAVLYHLRDNADWETTFAKLHGLTAPGGSVWITDLVAHEIAAVDGLMRERYADYLRSKGGDDYRDEVLAYIDREDPPRPVTYQLDLRRRVGFERVERLHKNSCFAAFGATKSGG